MSCSPCGSIYRSHRQMTVTSLSVQRAPCRDTLYCVLYRDMYSTRTCRGVILCGRSWHATIIVTGLREGLMNPYYHLYYRHTQLLQGFILLDTSEFYLNCIKVKHKSKPINVYASFDIMKGLFHHAKHTTHQFNISRHFQSLAMRVGQDYIASRQNCW